MLLYVFLLAYFIAFLYETTLAFLYIFSTSCSLFMILGIRYTNILSKEISFFTLANVARVSLSTVTYTSVTFTKIY